MLTTEATVVTVINMKLTSELPGNQDKRRVAWITIFSSRRSRQALSLQLIAKGI